MNRSLKLCLVAILALSLIPLAACSNVGNPLLPPPQQDIQPTNTSLPLIPIDPNHLWLNDGETLAQILDLKNDGVNLPLDELLWYWHLEASVNQKVDIGALSGLPGIYFTFDYDIVMNGRNVSEDSPLVGDYSIKIESSMAMDSNEAADFLFSQEVGTNVSGLGIGLNGSWQASYRTDEYVYLQPLSPNWRGVLRDMNGNRVYPAPGSYLIFEEVTLVYTGTAAYPLYTFDQVANQPIYLYLVIAPDRLGSSGLDEGEHEVTVFIRYPDLEGGDGDFWLTGSGTISLKLFATGPVV